MIFYPSEAVSAAAREVEYTLVILVNDKIKLGRISEDNWDLYHDRVQVLVDAIAEQGIG